jgi:sigma-B regulation protein RsbU (phosphoserine phosphatase)
MTTYVDNLHESNEFLNLLLDNINSAVLIADENLHIHQFNDSFLNLFDNATDSLMADSFGEITGCVNAVLEDKPCGETSQCGHCMLRRSLVQTLTENAPTERQRLERTFYINGEPSQKYLEFSTRRIIFQGREMFMVIIYDITDIERHKIELQQKQKLLDRDLEAAAIIQQNLLPDSAPLTDSLRTAWRFEPCDQIGGDIFNVLELNESNFGFYMLDVCGHGVPAALISVAVSQFLSGRRVIPGRQSAAPQPNAILKSLNRAFPFERFDSFFTIVCMKIDISNGIMSYSSAGHPPPILLRAAGGFEVLEHRGSVIGAGLDEVYGMEEKQLKPGDKILLYTDGINENRNLEGEDFGKKRFYETIEKNRHKPVDELVDAIYTTVKDFLKGAKPDDDISILGVEFTGSKSNHYSI